MENIYSVLITAISVLGGTTAFRFYEKRAMKKEMNLTVTIPNSVDLDLLENLF